MTSSGSTPPSSARPASGKRAATCRTSPTRWSTARSAKSAFEKTNWTTRKKPPFGIAQVGKSFRNEITPGNFVFRTREFEQMEMEYFVPPDEGPKWYAYWCNERMKWYRDLGMPDEWLRLRPHDPDELS